MVNAHDHSFARTIAWSDIKPIRAIPLEVKYISGGIFEFTCRLLDGETKILKADEEEPVRNLYNEQYGTGLAIDWITKIKKPGNSHIIINSTRDPDDPLNWYIYKDKIAFFATNDFLYIDIEKIQHDCPSTWKFDIKKKSEGLFGGIFELRNDANEIIKVNCGYNNAITSLNMLIDNKKIEDYRHNLGSYNKLIKDLNGKMT